MCKHPIDLTYLNLDHLQFCVLGSIKAELVICLSFIVLRMYLLYFLQIVYQIWLQTSAFIMDH